MPRATQFKKGQSRNETYNTKASNEPTILPEQIQHLERLAAVEAEEVQFLANGNTTNTPVTLRPGKFRFMSHRRKHY